MAFSHKGRIEENFRVAVATYNSHVPPRPGQKGISTVAEIDSSKITDEKVAATLSRLTQTRITANRPVNPNVAALARRAAQNVAAHG